MSLTPSDAKTLTQGAAAPDFSLPGADGNTHTLADFSEYEGLLIVFICNHCPFVLAKVDEMRKLYNEFGDKIAFVGINSNDPEYPGEGMDNMHNFVKEHSIQFPYLLDETQEIAKKYGATCTPDPFLFDRNRKLVFHGRLTDAMNPDDTPTEHTMYKHITTLLNGEKIESWFDPSLGCSIKWKN